MSIAIIDYGMGNLASVKKALKFLGRSAEVTSDPARVARADALILPGVGAFGEAMKELKARGLVTPIRESIAAGRPFLGLCLGLQLLFETSEESAGVRGLGILPGKVRRLPRKKGLKIPQMGWNQILPSPSPSPRGGEGRVRGNPLLKGVPSGAFMYFVHSFYADPGDRAVVAAETEYGCRFPSVVWDGGRVWATQFHPEKSQKWGLKILNNFLTMVKNDHHSRN